MRHVAHSSEAPSLPVEAARRGDPVAWDALLHRYQLPLFAYIMELVHHHATSLDLVQEVFLRATRHLPSLRDDSRFGSWLFGIAHQQVVQHWRRKGRSPFSDDPVPEDLADESPAPDDGAIRDEDSSRLLTAIDHLSPPHRSVILLHYLEEFPLAEIATITGASLGTVKSRLHYAKRELRKSLTPLSPEPLP
ncbi:MAG: RNA polymerase sigma factor [Limisphaerales bacterium]